VLNWSGYVTDTRPGTGTILRDAIRYAALHDVLVVVGAGNDRKDLDREENCVYPQCLDEPNLLRVAQLASDGSLYEYQVDGQRRGSNYGPRRVEIAAMGEHFTTGLRDNNSTYDLSNGTSNAAPVITGVAALVLSVRPALTTAELKRVLLESATILPALRGTVQGARAINPSEALRRALRR
jgi:subtilisin family serine protease